ncbi:DUF4153 domain-containing protein [Tissierella creatinophila]|uniref:DUF4153 domain-containing protein n=1 Tax=Tissierella creatinophila DSM 6911 TaxID=1123403 RepID=A0A1U7M5W2_TISCR|nr:DUF4153 domain-containing protein [Tissierella creatinophila]OLS02697.1 hypothetical protein TICRE_13420 [Tissierella creatinophila DSM 6911]
MINLGLQIQKVFKGAAKSFYRFPAAIISAIVISITAIIKITMDWEVQQTYTLLFDSIQISFFLGAVFSMATVALEEVRSDRKKSSFVLANVSGIVLAIISFLLLYFYGGKIGEDKIVYLSDIAMARVSVAIFVSIVAFVYITSKSKFVDTFSDSFFITQRAFIISAIYGLVIMAGVSGVLGAFQALVYRNLDSRVYQYLGVAVGFLTYTIFLGYFPSFRGTENKEEIDKVKEQPRFIFVLFDYILIPIIMALTVVLLIWSVRVLLKGVDVSFNQLSSIASSYVIIGIWLYIMVSKHDTKIAEFYKRVYPFAGILILIFEAWALFAQLNKFGLKTAEYSFLMIWIFAIISVLLLIFLKDKAYRKVAITAIVISIIWVLPIIGYQDITFNSQVNRLRKTLINEKLLVDDKIVSNNKEVEYVIRGEITDAVDFISYSEKQNTPIWFKKDLNDEKVFKDTFGFEKTYGVYPDPSEYTSSNFRLETDAIDISDYSLSLRVLPNEKSDTTNRFKGKNGSYEIMITREFQRVPKIIVKLEDKIIVEEDMSKYLSDLSIKYNSKQNSEIKVPFEDMNVIIETEDISILLVFDNINIYRDQIKEKTDYYVELHGIFVKNK